MIILKYDTHFPTFRTKKMINYVGSVDLDSVHDPVMRSCGKSNPKFWPNSQPIIIGTPSTQKVRLTSP